MRNVSDKYIRGNQYTYSVLIKIFPNIVPFYEIMWKVSVVRGQARDATKARAHFMLDNKGDTHTLYMYYLLLSPATIVARTHLTLGYTHIVCLVKLCYAINILVYMLPDNV